MLRRNKDQERLLREELERKREERKRTLEKLNDMVLVFNKEITPKTTTASHSG